MNTLAEVTEEWRPVIGWEETHEVSNLGQVRRLENSTTQNGRQKKSLARLLTRSKHANGYLRVKLSIPGLRREAIVRKLVAEAFHGPTPQGSYVVHRDGDYQNCSALNLAYLTPGETRNLVVQRHAHKRTHCKRGHKFVPSNIYQTVNGRSCRACSSTHSYLRRHPENRVDFQRIADAYYSKFTFGRGKVTPQELQPQ